MTQDEAKMLASAIDTHISMLYRYAEAYRRNGNVEAQLDCFNEVNKFKALKEKICSK